MHADALVVARDAGQESGNFNIRISPESLQRERTVLAATPTEKNSLSHHPKRCLAIPIEPVSSTIPVLVRITGQSLMTIP